MKVNFLGLSISRKQSIKYIFSLVTLVNFVSMVTGLQGMKLTGPLLGIKWRLSQHSLDEFVFQLYQQKGKLPSHGEPLGETATVAAKVAKLLILPWNG